MSLYRNDKRQRYDKLIKDILDPRLDLTDISDRFWHLSPSYGYSRPYSRGYDNVRGDFRISLDVQNFNYNDLQVRASEGYVVIEGKHEERKDEHGFVMRHFRRKFPLPKNISPEDLVPTLSPDGMLTLTAPGKNNYFYGRNRNIPIAIVTEPS